MSQMRVRKMDSYEDQNEDGDEYGVVVKSNEDMLKTTKGNRHVNMILY